MDLKAKHSSNMGDYILLFAKRYIMDKKENVMNTYEIQLDRKGRFADSLNSTHYL